MTVEVHLANGLPSFTLVGLADVEVKEARERVRSAIQNAGLEFPNNKRITVNLAPADLPKDSGRFDLPIALGILAASGQIDAGAAGRARIRRRAVAVGPSCGRCVARWPWRWRCMTQGVATSWCCRPKARSEAALVPGAEVYGARHLIDVVRQCPPAGAEAAARARAARGRLGPRHRRSPGGTGALPRPGRCQRPGRRQAGARNRRRRRAFSC